MQQVRFQTEKEREKERKDGRAAALWNTNIYSTIAQVEQLTYD